MASHAFGSELRRWRNLAGLTVRDLAARVHMGSSTVSSYENGIAPHPKVAAQLDAALNAKGVLVELAERLNAPAIGAGSAGSRLITGTAGGPVVTGPPSSEEIMMAAEESAKFARDAARSATPDLVEQLDADVRRLAVAYLHHPPFTLFRPLAAMQTEVFELIDSRPNPAYLADLYLAAGRLTALLAHASADLGQPAAAAAHARTAWLCADRAGHNSLRVYTRWVQANVAYWNGDYRTAAELAASARPYASGGSDMLRLASQEARAHAALGDGAAVERALGDGLAAQEPASGASEPGVFHFAPGKAAYYSAEVRLALGGTDNNRRAVADAERAVALLTEGPDAVHSAELVAAARQDLSAAHLALHDLDAVREVLAPVLDLPAELRTTPIAGRMTKLDQQLHGPGADARADELHEQIALFLAYPAGRALPPVA
ncbi:helix-turn-helix transcriptional regulator [Longispora sp. NPDC051575]|uniref:helix-turn-helix domain-containing protein n=1 Tax=Longispora sp. NPDC051575 TaxID=3154943 RepID=UPI003436ECE8